MNGIDLAIYRAKKIVEQRNIGLMEFLNSNEIKYFFVENYPFPNLIQINRKFWSKDLDNVAKEAGAEITFLDSTFVIQLDFFNHEMTGNF